MHGLRGLRTDARLHSRLRHAAAAQAPFTMSLRMGSELACSCRMRIARRGAPGNPISDRSHGMTSKDWSQRCGAQTLGEKIADKAGCLERIPTSSSAASWRTAGSAGRESQFHYRLETAVGHSLHVEGHRLRRNIPCRRRTECAVDLSSHGNPESSPRVRTAPHSPVAVAMAKRIGFSLAAERLQGPSSQDVQFV